MKPSTTEPENSCADQAEEVFYFLGLIFSKLVLFCWYEKYKCVNFLFSCDIGSPLFFANLHWWAFRIPRKKRMETLPHFVFCVYIVFLDAYEANFLFLKFTHADGDYCSNHFEYPCLHDWTLILMPTLFNWAGFLIFILFIHQGTPEENKAVPMDSRETPEKKNEQVLSICLFIIISLEFLFIFSV